MADTHPNLAELDNRIAIIRDNLRQLIEQAAGSSGAGDESLMSDRIAAQEAKLKELTERRDKLLNAKR